MSNFHRLHYRLEVSIKNSAKMIINATMSISLSIMHHFVFSNFYQLHFNSQSYGDWVTFMLKPHAKR